MSNEGKVCVVSGAAGGIGAAVVKKFYDNGYKVIMLDINEEALQKSIEEEKYQVDRIDYFVLDISSEDQVKAAADAVFAVEHTRDNCLYGSFRRALVRGAVAASHRD